MFVLGVSLDGDPGTQYVGRKMDDDNDDNLMLSIDQPVIIKSPVSPFNVRLSKTS